MNCIVCGHPKNKHEQVPTRFNSFCYQCRIPLDEDRKVDKNKWIVRDEVGIAEWDEEALKILTHKFEDNLDFIERIAKEKGLI